MANYTTLQKGSSNTAENKKLQQALKDNGYGSYLGSAGVDGIYGSGTDAGVRAFQKDKGLQVDGIVGEKTWGALLSGSNTNAQTTQQPAPVTQPEKSYRYDADNDPVYQAAKQKVTDLETAGKPVLQGTYDQQVEALFNEIMGQKDFTYDLNGDALWQQYKDQYTTQGKLAMMDTMGQAAALTGGYGSSYGQNVGQQAYQGYLQQLSDRVPELYQLALQKYNNDQALLQEKYAAARDLQNDEYGRYRDETSDYYTDLGLAKDDENTLWNRGNSTWLTEQELRTQEEETAYNRKQDAYNKLVTMIAGTGYTPTAAELEAAGMNQQQATALAMQYDKEQSAAAAAAGGSGGGGGSVETEVDIPSEIKSQIGKLETDAEKDRYISSLEQRGIISAEEAEYARGVYLTAIDSDEGNDNTTAFTKTLMSKEDWRRRTGSAQGYDEWMAHQMASAYESGKLTYGELEWLVNEHGLQDVIYRLGQG